MTDLKQLIRDLVVANRIIANENIVDAYGHISVRHPDQPDRFLISRSRSPSLVNEDDIMTLLFDGTSAEPDDRPPYLERFIHGAIYRARPDIHSILHSHATEVLPYTVSALPMRPVINNAGVIGAQVPVWDIAAHFGSDTNLLVTNEAQGVDLAATLAENKIVLMRGHGFTAAGRNLIETIRMSLYLKVNAAVLSEALRLGDVTYLSPGEIAAIGGLDPNAPELKRAWQYWASRADCADMVA